MASPKDKLSISMEELGLHASYSEEDARYDQYIAEQKEKLGRKPRSKKGSTEIEESLPEQQSFEVDYYDLFFREVWMRGGGVSPRDEVSSAELDIIDDVILDFDFNDVDGALDKNGWARGYKDASKSKAFVDAFNYSIQKMAIDVDPSNIFLFTVPVHPEILIEAIQKEPYLLKMAPHYKRAFTQIYENVPDSVLAEALSKDGLLLKYIPSSRLDSAKDNNLCVTAVKQNIKAFSDVPVGQKWFDGELNADVGRVDKKHVCMDENVIDAFLSHSIDEPSLYRSLEEEWITPNVIVSALKYNFNSIKTMGTEWEGNFLNVRRMPDEQPDSATIRVTRDVISELKPEIFDLIVDIVSEKPSLAGSIPKNLLSPRLAGELACAGSIQAKMAFREFPFERQLEYFREKREYGALRGRDYMILDMHQVSSLEVDDFVYCRTLNEQFPEVAADLVSFGDINSLNEQLTTAYTRATHTGDHNYRKSFGRREFKYGLGKKSLVSGQYSPIMSYDTGSWGLAHSETREANTSLLENQYRDLLSDMRDMYEINSLGKDIRSYIDNVAFDSEHYRDVEQLIMRFNWSYNPAHDSVSTSMYENEKFDIACECVAKRGGLIGLVYDEIYPNGMPSKEMESYINAIAVRSDPTAYPLVPNPSVEITQYACGKVPENAAYVEPDIIGVKNWEDCIVKGCCNNPMFFINVMLSEHVGDDLLRRVVDNKPEASMFMLPTQFCPEILGGEKWTEVATNDVKGKPQFIRELDENSGCTVGFIKMIAEEAPECVEYMTDRQLRMLNSIPIGAGSGDEPRSPVLQVAKTSSNEER